MLKKFLCIILTLLLALSIVACSNKDEDADDSESSEKTEETSEKEEKEPEKDEKSDEEEVKETVTGFYDAICKFDMKDAVSYLDEDVDVPFDDSDDLVELALEKACEDNDIFASVKDEFKPVFVKMVDAMQKTMKYKIKDCDVDKDSATVEVEFEMFDNDAVKFEDFDMDDMDFDFEQYVADLAADGKITDEMEEEEMLKVIMPKMAEVMGDWMEKKVSEAPVKTGTKELEMEKKGGKWVIKSDDSVNEMLEGFDKIAE